MTQDFLRLWGGLLLLLGGLLLYAAVVDYGSTIFEAVVVQFLAGAGCITLALGLWGMAKVIDLLMEIGVAKKAKAAEG